MDKLKGWRYALIVSLVTASAVGLAYRRWRGRAGKTGFLLATAAGVGGFMAASQRWELKQISSEEILKAFFPGPAADLFSRLPAAIETLQGRLGSDELYIEGKVEGFAMLRRLIDLSCSQRKPYSEARALLDQQSNVSMKVPPEELTEGLQLLPYAEATYEEDDVVNETCHERGHAVLKLVGLSKPGAPAHFLSFDATKKLAILSVRGTKTPADALTDLAGDIQQRDLEDGKKLYAHAGFLTAADSVLQSIRGAVRDLLAPLGYSLLVTGHSLGASTACLVTRLLYAEMTSWSSQLSSIRCVAFAPCPCMDAVNAAGCAESLDPSTSLVLSFVCNDDAVPRIMQNLGRLSLLGKGASVKEVLQLAVASRLRDSDQHLPGKVVVLHQNEEASSDDSKTSKRPGRWTAWAGNAPDFPEIGYVELSPKSITHHMAPVYREALAVVASKRGIALEAAARADEAFADWRLRVGDHADHAA